ncbi:MAG TPA: NAD(P)/FAD-dependent oxidoreductase [Kofleriaceae bacterium]|nr:NAD(P)/FAD-dependent oxidoreductase [Kofleriaceae bacterium]
MAGQRDIVIVGAGHAGLCLAAQLRRAGHRRITLLERGDRLGGTWRDNIYPGAACDTPAFSYCFSFAQKRDWSRKWAPQAEILGYLEQLADDHDLRRHIHTGVAVAGARRQGGRWRLRTSAGDIDADVLISAVGQLGRPRLPHFAGLADFAGSRFHSAAWPRGWDPAGRDVAVIGSAASAVQLVPAIAPRVRRLTVFQRSPNWILPMDNRAFRPWERALLERVPAAARLYRWYLYYAFEARYPVIRARPWAAGRATELALEHLTEQVADPELRRRLTPDYPIAAKRVLLSDDYYPALQQGNVRLVTEPIECFTRAGLVTRDGREHRVDAAIFATGFDATAFLAPMEISGEGGVTLAARWAAGASAYLGITVPGFPNLFLMYGPNTNLGHNSILFMLECQARYIVDCLRQMDRRGLRSIDVRAEVHARWLRAVERDLADTAWAQVDDSWYRHESGRITNNWPRSTLAYYFRTRRADMSDFIAAR